VTGCPCCATCRERQARVEVIHSVAVIAVAAWLIWTRQ